MLRDKARKLPEGSRPRPTLLKEQWPEALSMLLKKEGLPADWDGRASERGLLLQGTPLLLPRLLKEGRGLGEAKAPEVVEVGY